MKQPRPLNDAWGSAYRLWVRKGLDQGMAAFLADGAERAARRAHHRRRRRKGGRCDG